MYYLLEALVGKIQVNVNTYIESLGAIQLTYIVGKGTYWEIVFWKVAKCGGNSYIWSLMMIHGLNVGQVIKYLGGRGATLVE